MRRLLLIMKLISHSFEPNTYIPAKYAFCKLNDKLEVELSDNINPAFSWVDIPEGTKSLALICVDSEVPTSGENVNKEGVTVPYDLPRTNFYHWLLINIPVNSPGIKEGEFSDKVTPGGKKDINSSQGTKQGINDYTNWFAGDEKMAGDYYGYDGPCPPWNDERVHKYHFELYALSIEKLPVPDRFTGKDFDDAIKNFILEKNSIMGLYTLNKNLLK